jgi:hypothetical protein
MKIGGVQVSKCEELLVLPRGNGDDIPFRAKAVAINEEFDSLVPMPVAPMIQTKEGKSRDYSDAEYKKAVARRSEQRFAFLCIKSLEPSEIEWETVDLEKPATWVKWSDELMAAGISETECNRIVGIVMIANSLDEDKIEEARKAFLRGQGA